MNLYSNQKSADTALLVIDITNSDAHEQCEMPEWNIRFSKIREMVPRLVNFIDLFRSTVNGLIAFIKSVPWKREYLPQNINELYTDPKAYYYSADETDFSKQFYLVKPTPDDIIITKNSYSAFADTNLDQILRDNGIQYLVITGLFGDGCVLATICEGFSRGYNFVILEDLVETTDVPIRQELLKNLITFTWPRMYGKTMRWQEFLDSWRK